MCEKIATDLIAYVENCSGRAIVYIMSRIAFNVLRMILIIFIASDY